MLPLVRAALAALCLVTSLTLPAAAGAAEPARVAIIVGPVGSLTPTYLALAERAAATAEQHGAVVARAYSPNATPANVLAAVEDANIVVYFGHGYGHPSPYGGHDPLRQNGWALQGPAARGTHEDGLDGFVQYLGEDWIVANARPAPGFVMIYSNTCYAPGASEGGMPAATSVDAALRVAHYSRPVFALGGSAYYATDFDAGAADLVGRLLGDRDATYGSVFAADARFSPAGLTTQAHPLTGGQQVWTHRSVYAKGDPNYWYAFAGNPDLAPRRAWDATAPTIVASTPKAGAVDVTPDAELTIRMSEAVSGVSGRTVRLRDGGGRDVPVDVTYDASTRTATVAPRAPLALSRAYALEITGDIVDGAGRSVLPVTIPFTTRLDADPIDEPFSLVLESGAHELLRVRADGTAAESTSVDVVDRRWLVADIRARLPGRPGSWLRVTGDGALDGLWIAESPRAHALGLAEESALAAGTTVTLDRAALPPALVATAGRLGDVDASAGRMAVAVDRRRVEEGRTSLRLADPRAAGTWIEVLPAASSTEAASIRLLGRSPTGSAAVLVLDAGVHALYRFDTVGRVVERRTVTLDAPGSVAVTELLTVSHARFAAIADGPLAGWSVRESSAVRLLAATAPAAPIDEGGGR